LEKHPIRPVGGAEGAPIELRSYEAILSRPPTPVTDLVH
jgi:hypothetical protein